MPPDVKRRLGDPSQAASSGHRTSETRANGNAEPRQVASPNGSSAHLLGLPDLLDLLGIMREEFVQLGGERGGRFGAQVLRRTDVDAFEPPQDRDAWFGPNPSVPTHRASAPTRTTSPGWRRCSLTWT